jgi:hypothetical protein
VGDELHGPHAEVEQDLGSHAVVPQVRLKAKTMLGLDGIAPFVLQAIGLQLVQEADTAPFLAHVQEDATPARSDGRERGFQLVAAVTAERVEQVARHALRVDTDQRRHTGLDVAHDQGQVES